MNMKYIITTLCALFLFLPTANAEESTYDRIMKSGKIRCGYVAHEPYIIIDPNTKNMRGVFYDLMEEIGKRQGFIIEWTEEVGWGNFIEGLKTNRYDILCSGGWNSANEGKLIGYTKPIYFNAVGIWVRIDDNRFDDNFESLNDPSVTVASTDGSLISVIAKTDFPKAKISSLPNLNMASDTLNMVKTKKADVTFVATDSGAKFLDSNPDTLKNIAVNRPVRLFPSSIIIPHGDFRLKQTLDAGIDELIYSGYVDKLLDKYEKEYPDAFYRIRKNFEIPAK